MFQTLSRAMAGLCIMMSAAHAAQACKRAGSALETVPRTAGAEPACCMHASYEDLIAMAAKRSGLTITTEENGRVRYTMAPDAKSTVILGYVLEVSPETGDPTEASKARFAQFRTRINAYMKGSDSAPGVAEHHGGFITAICLVAPAARWTQSPPFLPTPLPDAARREENLRLFRQATGAKGAQRAPSLPPDSVIVLFNDLQWGRMPPAMSIDQAIEFLEAVFASRRHQLTREEADSEKLRPCLPSTNPIRSQP